MQIMQGLASGLFCGRKDVRCSLRVLMYLESDVSAARIVAQLAGKKTAAREDRRLVSKAGNQPRLIAIPARQVAAAVSIR